MYISKILSTFVDEYIMMSIMTSNLKNIRLSQLFLNTENYRFEPVASQKEAINKMIEDQGEKLFALVSDIVQNGLNPADSIMVSLRANKTNEYIVLEGNRRVTSLKLLCTPSLIGDNYSSLRKKFAKLQVDNKEKILTIIECCVFEDPSDADIWIKRKHSGALDGMGTVTWNAQQKQRFEEKTEGISSISLQVITLLKSHESVPSDVKENLSKISVTNLSRLIADPYVREKMGISLNSGILSSKNNVDEIVKGLLKVVTDILSPSFKVAEIYDSKKRKQYIDSVPSEIMPNIDSKSEISWELQSYKPIDTTATNIESQAEIDRPKNIHSTPTIRRVLIPKSCNLKIEQPKINKIYSELKSLLVYNCPNAASILFRVFLELSIDTYIEKKGLIKGGALTASASNENLDGKVSKVLNHMFQNNLMNNDLAKGIRAELKDVHSVISVDSLNAYVHSTIFYTKADNLIVGWDTVQPFIEILWSNINKKID